MERAREVSRAGSSRTRARAEAGADVHVEHEEVLRFAREAGFRTRFVGYETTEAETVLRVAEGSNGWVLAKLDESPFYPEGGGQVSDSGLVETPSGRARVADVYRLGDDQALALELLEGEIGPGEDARAVVERAERLATMRNHTATHLLHAALRTRLGTHVRQAGLLRGPRQAALRLHPRRTPQRRGASRRGRAAGRLDRGAARGARPRDHSCRGRGARRARAVRREVRGLGADGGDRGGVARAVRRYPRGGDRRAGALPPERARPRARPTCAGSRP